MKMSIRFYLAGDELLGAGNLFEDTPAVPDVSMPPPPDAEHPKTLGTVCENASICFVGRDVLFVCFLEREKSLENNVILNR